MFPLSPTPPSPALPPPPLISLSLKKLHVIYYREQYYISRDLCHKTTGTTNCYEIKQLDCYLLPFSFIFVLRGEYLICILSATGAPLCTWTIGCYFFLPSSKIQYRFSSTEL